MKKYSLLLTYILILKIWIDFIFDYQHWPSNHDLKLLYCRNPTPHGEEDPLLGITWPAIGNSNTHLEISDKLEVSNCSVVNNVEFYETLLTLVAPVMGGCISASESKEHLRGFNC